jgi:uncharacterized protein
VASLARERHTDAALAWFKRQPPGSLAISPWVVTEVAGALSQKSRAREIDESHRLVLRRTWDALITSSLGPIAIEDRHFTRATEFLDQPGINLRAGDALHLAIAAENRLAIATLDRRMGDAALLLGIDVSLSPPAN